MTKIMRSQVTERSDKGLLEELRNTYIPINRVQNTCRMCGKEHDPIDSHVTMIRGHVVCTCPACTDRILDFIQNTGDGKE